MNLGDADVVPRIGEAPSLSLYVDRQPILYHVGLNIRQEHLSNPHFRRALGRLLDKELVVDRIMAGYAKPASSPFPHDDWTPATLAWDDGDSTVPFIGTDGMVDRRRARERFREMGYEYHDGALVAP
jgi:peptide/nickel transport system substrate-binding protein